MARGLGGRSLANITRFLQGIDFPARKQELLNTARRNNADQDVIDELDLFEDREYTNMADVMQAYGVERAEQKEEEPA